MGQYSQEQAREYIKRDEVNKILNEFAGRFASAFFASDVTLLTSDQVTPNIMITDLKIAEMNELRESKTQFSTVNYFAGDDEFKIDKKEVATEFWRMSYVPNNEVSPIIMALQATATLIASIICKEYGIDHEDDDIVGIYGVTFDNVSATMNNRILEQEDNLKID